MPFRFVHTADWQIGKPFRSLGERMAGKLEEARLSVIDRIAELARARGAGHVLAAGDVYDAEGVPQKTLLQPLARMREHQDIRWWLLPGNHDPVRPAGIWQRVAALGLPPNVVCCTTPTPIQLAPGVLVLPAPLTGKGTATDPTSWMDAAATPAGSRRIGLAHGSVQSFGSQGESAVPISPERARAAGLDYLALGDWHGCTAIDDRTWYSGTPEPDRFPDNEPGFALVVTLAGAGAPGVERHRTAHFTWARHTADISHGDDLAAVERAVASLAPATAQLLVELRLTGVLPLEVHAQLDLWVSRLDARLAYLDADLSALAVQSTVADLARLGEGGELRWAADRLTRIASDPSAPDRAIAEAALVRLLQLAQEAGRETAA